MSVETNRRLEAYVEAVPKIELHVHIEGTLESAQMYCIGQRNQIRLDDTPETHRKIRVGGGGEASKTPVHGLLFMRNLAVYIDRGDTLF